MFDEIRRLVDESPFYPFLIVMSSGKQYRVASADHIDFSPSGKRLVIWFDDDTFATVSPLHVSSVEGDAPQTSQST